MSVTCIGFDGQGGYELFCLTISFSMLQLLQRRGLLVTQAVLAWLIGHHLSSIMLTVLFQVILDSACPFVCI